VTGPDEYTTVVNDNLYTNVMARFNMRYAARVVESLREWDRDAYDLLVRRVGLDEEEIKNWIRASDSMYLPYDEELGINPQDDTFLELEPWDFENTPPDKYPLLLHYHPLVIYRHQVIKQADVVLAMYLLGNEFREERKRANFDYYDKLTTGDSSLSACVQSIVAAEVGHQEAALEYFRFALLMDLADVAGNVSDGVHIASAAGVWQALVMGFGGVRDYDGELSLIPHLPAPWQSLAFSLRFGDRQLRIRLGHDEERFLVEDGDPLEIRVRGEAHVLRPGQPLVLEVAAPVATAAPDG
jgi:alpha,alpha-trehalose phosphorylase